MYAVYLNEKNEFVLEIAVPGRGGDDLEVIVNEDESIRIVMPPKANTPGSMLAGSYDGPITGLNEHFDVHRLRVTCTNGLLALYVPIKPESLAKLKASQGEAVHPIPRIDPAAIFRNRLRKFGQ